MLVRERSQVDPSRSGGAGVGQQLTLAQEPPRVYEEGEGVGRRGRCAKGGGAKGGS